MSTGNNPVDILQEFMSVDENHPFSSFGLSGKMLEAITRKGWTAPTPIQSIALPRLLGDDDHLIVKARTGTGKTAAFGIPLIEKLNQAGHAPRSLILTPTRELALQVSKEIASLVSGAYPRVTAVYGGASIRNQILDLRRGTEIVVGTPGRIMDLQERKALDLSVVDWFILDEADEMLDMGFFEDVEKIFASVKQGVVKKASGNSEQENSQNDAEPADTRQQQAARQVRVALFSATMPDPILRVVRKYIGEVDILEDAAPEDEKPAVDQFFIVVKREDKLETLRRLIDQAANFYGLIFCATKAETDELARRLVEAGYPAEAIHGDLTQEVRERTLRRFRLHRTKSENGAAILVATDVAARGIDIEALTHVINWDLPNDSESYVHRIGRTGRAGRRGIAVSLALPSERGRISRLSRNMERSLGSGIQWLGVPSVKSVMKAARRRIVSSIAAVLPIQDAPPAEQAPETEKADAMPDTSPFLAKLYRELIERMGAEQALAAMVTLNYGDMLDPSRYGPVAEFSENDCREPVGGGREERGRRREGHLPRTGGHTGSRAGGKGAARRPGKMRGDGVQGGAEGLTRLYVGLGRRHGASARDVAGLLMRAGGVPGRLVDEIEMKDYCSFATLPADAAKRACAFSHNGQNDTEIRPATH
jgi:ATP-dependent RNA helicase DeaD